MIRRTALALAASVVSLVLGVAAPAVAESEDNAAIAVNTQDGASLFRLAFSVQTVANGTIDETNTAAALARCEDCQTVALAFQVVLVYGDADVVVPENRAIAFNDECSVCLTYASATQIVLGVPHGTHFTQAGRDRLRALQERLAALEGTVGGAQRCGVGRRGASGEAGTGCDHPRGTRRSSESRRRGRYDDNDGSYLHVDVHDYNRHAGFDDDV